MFEFSDVCGSGMERNERGWKGNGGILTFYCHPHSAPTSPHNKAIKITTTSVCHNGKQQFLACLQLKVLFLFSFFTFYYLS